MLYSSGGRKVLNLWSVFYNSVQKLLWSQAVLLCLTSAQSVHTSMNWIVGRAGGQRPVHSQFLIHKEGECSPPPAKALLMIYLQGLSPPLTHKTMDDQHPPMSPLFCVIFHKKWKKTSIAERKPKHADQRFSLRHFIQWNCVNSN